MNPCDLQNGERIGHKTGGGTVGNSILEEEQITKLYQEMYGRMVAYAFSALRDRSLAEEAVQDTFCIFCTKDGDTQLENPQGWLMRTLQNVMRNMKRHRAVMNRLIMASVQMEDLEKLLAYHDEEDVDVLYEDLAVYADFQLLKRVVLDGCTMVVWHCRKGDCKKSNFLL